MSEHDDRLDIIEAILLADRKLAALNGVPKMLNFEELTGMSEKHLKKIFNIWRALCERAGVPFP